MGAWSKFYEENEKHLAGEEKVMMPKVKAMKEAGVLLKKLMIEDIISGVWDDENFIDDFLKVAMETLEKHHGDMPRARVFIHALKTISPPEKWEKFQPAVKESLSKELYTKIDKEINLSTPGP